MGHKGSHICDVIFEDCRVPAANMIGSTEVIHVNSARVPALDASAPTAKASCAKMFASEMCGRVADRAVQIFGGAGYLSEYGIERFYRDVRLFRLFEGTTQIQELVIARNMIRNPAG